MNYPEKLNNLNFFFDGGDNELKLRENIIVYKGRELEC